MKRYNTRFIDSKNYQEYIINIDSLVSYNFKRKGTSKERRSFNDLTTREKIESLEKKMRYYKEKKFEIRRYIDCNYVDNMSSFLTLTFAENIKDVARANKEFTNFIKRLKRYLEKNYDIDLKYIATWETQQRGAIHYHIVLFNVPFLKKSMIQNEIWKLGFVQINKISSDVKKENKVAVYITKYFAKDIEKKSEYKKSYFKSQNLIKPKEVKKQIDYDSMNDIVTAKDVVYVKEFKKVKFVGIVDDEKVFEEINCLYVVKKKETKKACKKNEKVVKLDSINGIKSINEFVDNKKELSMCDNSSLG
jgi:rep protein